MKIKVSFIESLEDFLTKKDTMYDVSYFINYRRDFLAGLFEALLLVAGALFASRRLADVL